MKPNEITTRSFKIFQAPTKLPNIPVQVKLKSLIHCYVCRVYRKCWCLYYAYFFGVFNEAILKDSDYGEVDRAECQFTTTGTVLDNGTQVCSFLRTSLEIFKSLFSYETKTVVLFNLINVDSPSGNRLWLLYFRIQSSILLLWCFLKSLMVQNFKLWEKSVSLSKIRMGLGVCVWVNSTICVGYE
jgi:hypothetical protein